MYTTCVIPCSGRWKAFRWILILGISTASGLQAAPPEDAFPLAPEAPVEREITKGEIHTYSLAVPAGHFVQVVVEQHGVDVELVLRDAEDEELLHRDSLHGASGRDRLSTITEQGGRLTLEIRTGHAEPDSRYELRLVALRPAREPDRLLAQAEDLSFQAMVAAFRSTLAADEDPTKALQFGQRAVELWSRAFPMWQTADDAQGEAETLRWSALTWHRMGMLHYERGDLLDARDCFARALELRRQFDPPDLPRLAQTLTNLAGITSDLGEYQRALGLLEEAHSLWERWGEEHKDRTATINNLAHAYSRLGDFRTARRFYEEALARNLEGNDSEWKAKTLHNLAWTLHALDEHEAALERYDETLELARELELRELEGTIQESRGRLFEELDRWDEAEACFRKALDIRHAQEDRRGELVVLHGLGRLQWKRGELAAARKTLGRGETLLETVATNHPYFQARHAMLRARIESGSGEHGKALEHAEAALDELESLRAEVIRQDLRTTFLSARHGFYETAVGLAMTAHGQQPKAGYDALAFTWNERARARSFLESLARADVDPSETVDPELAERERTLRREINLLAAGDSEKARSQVEDKLLALNELRGRMARSGAKGFEEAARPLDLDAIRHEVLEPDTLLLEYSLGDERSFLWVVSQDTLWSYELPGRKTLEERVREAHQLLATGGARADSREWAAVAADLSRTLLAPAARQLRRHRLVIVPDGALHYLPFAALPHPKDPTSPLLARHEVVHEVSASAVAILRRQAKNRPPAPKTLAVFAHPDFEDVDLEPLPATETEAKTLAEWVPQEEAWIVLGEEARRDRVLNGPLERYRYVHFATHSRVDEEHPELSGIALTEGFLRLHDLYDLRLNADLVTLSACETALGRQVTGEGLIGLTRGFFHAGAERVLSSLWSVDDRATMELMTQVYHGLLQDGERPAAALRQAQLELLESERYGGPSFWAGFVLQGEWR